MYNKEFIVNAATRLLLKHSTFKPILMLYDQKINLEGEKEFLINNWIFVKKESGKKRMKAASN